MAVDSSTHSVRLVNGCDVAEGYNAPVWFGGGICSGEKSLS